MRFVLVFVAALIITMRGNTSGQIVQIDLRTMTASAPKSQRHSVGDKLRIETIGPDGQLFDGTWEAVGDDRSIRGLRVVGVRIGVEEELVIDVIHTKILSQASGAQAGEVRQVPHSDVIEIGHNQSSSLTPAILLFKQLSMTLVWVPRDLVGEHDATTIPTITELRDGTIRAGHWQQNYANVETNVLYFGVPSVAEVHADGSYELRYRSYSSSREHGRFPADYLKENVNCRSVPLIRNDAAVPSNLRNVIGPTCPLQLDLVEARVTTENLGSVQISSFSK